MLRQPIYAQISSAALGCKLKNDLYKPADVVCSVDPRKVAPSKLDNFWGKVFQKCGLVVEEVDYECLGNLSEFKSEILDMSTGDIRMVFKFNPITDYFLNQSLVLQLKNGTDGLQWVRRDRLNYKTGRVEGSLFTLLFDPKEEEEGESMSVALQVSHNYGNALYFYFREENIQQEEEQNNQQQK